MGALIFNTVVKTGISTGTSLLKRTSTVLLNTPSGAKRSFVPPGRIATTTSSTSSLPSLPTNNHSLVSPISLPIARPLHDPFSSTALVLDRVSLSSDEVAVVVDPYLVRHLKPHQRDGVQVSCTHSNIIKSSM
jgi:DNA repair and recombination protein RAD54B